jgi:hypothetical protein
MTTPLEEQFIALVTKVQAEIRKHTDAARKELTAATKLADEHGISFHSSVSDISQSYIAEVPAEYEELDRAWMSEIMDVRLDGDYGGGGWEHSSVC